MWLRRLKTKAGNPPETPAVSSPAFSLSSFKDIQSLCEEEDNNNNNNNNVVSSSSNYNSSTPKSRFSNVLHRVRNATSLLRAFSNQKKAEENAVQESLHHGDKDNVVLEKDQILVEEPTSIREVDDLVVDDNVGELIQSLKSLPHGEKDNGVVLEKGDLEKNQELIEEPASIGEVGDVDDNVVRIELPGTETRVVIFFTSLRVVRSTFEDCKYARTILHSFPVAIDERDLFMDGRFMKELQRIMGMDENTILTLPRVFIGGRYMGGAEEIRQLHEAGELKKYLEGLAPAPRGTCEVCGGLGFILCLECNGSHKCYEEKGGFKPCSGCNENGLVRCPSCSSAPL